jgi:hypothetical protein
MLMKDPEESKLNKENKMSQGKMIGNVNILDLRKATEASVAEISRIGNVNVALYSKETAGLISRLNIGNINASVEVPSDVKAKTSIGRTVFNHAFVKESQDPVFEVAIGQVIVETDVTAEDIQNGFAGLVVIGQLVCPESLLGAIRSKAEQVIGETKSYPLLKQVKIGGLTLDARALQGMEDDTEMAVIGNLTLPDVLANELLAQKIHKLFVLDGIKCREENAAFIQSKLVTGSGSVSSIPAGFEWVDKSITLDNDLLETFTGKKLYCSGRVVIDASVTPTMLDEHLAAIVGEEMFCPLPLKSVFSQKCDLLKTQVVFYEGELWTVDGEENLSASRFDYLEGKATLLVSGMLNILPEVDPKVLASRLAKIHNKGVIKCTPAQMGAVQARLGIHEGVVADSTQHVEEESPNAIGNANLLAL